jgi:hypothetical protein
VGGVRFASAITISGGKLHVPENPIIPFIEARRAQTHLPLAPVRGEG